MGYKADDPVHILGKLFPRVILGLLYARLSLLFIQYPLGGGRSAAKRLSNGYVITNIKLNITFIPEDRNVTTNNNILEEFK